MESINFKILLKNKYGLKWELKCSGMVTLELVKTFFQQFEDLIHDENLFYHKLFLIPL